MAIIATTVIIMTFLSIVSFFADNKAAIITGVLSGVVIGFFSWIIHLITNTSPHIKVSNKISHNIGFHESDGFFRVKIRNNNLSDLKIISANFIISYNPNPEKQQSKNDIVIATKKEDPLLFGLLARHRFNNLRTFDTFVIDAQKCIDKDTIETKTSPSIQTIFKNEKLTIEDFFKEDQDAILSAVFYVQNHRTGITRNYCKVFHGCDIVEGRFESGRSLKIEQQNDNPKGSDV